MVQGYKSRIKNTLFLHNLSFSLETDSSCQHPGKDPPREAEECWSTSSIHKKDFQTVLQSHVQHPEPWATPHSFLPQRGLVGLRKSSKYSFYHLIMSLLWSAALNHCCTQREQKASPEVSSQVWAGTMFRGSRSEKLWHWSFSGK